MKLIKTLSDSSFMEELEISLISNKIRILVWNGVRDSHAVLGGGAEFGSSSEGSGILCAAAVTEKSLKSTALGSENAPKGDFQGQTAGNGDQRGWERSSEMFCALGVVPDGPNSAPGQGLHQEKEQLLFCTEAKQTQINGTESASTMLKDLILWIIKYPLERKILIGLQACE